MFRLTSGLAVLVVFVGVGKVDAAFITFTDQPSFLAAAGPVMTETFEDEAVVGTPDGGGVTALSFDWFSVASTEPALKIPQVAYVGMHNTTPGGRKYLAADTDVAQLSTTVTFSDGPLRAIGFFIIDLDGTQGSFARVAISGNNFDIPAGGDASEAYFGVISDTPFSAMQVSIPVGFDSAYAFDDVSGSAVPEPSTLALLVMGAVGLLVYVCRRRRLVEGNGVRL